MVMHGIRFVVATDETAMTLKFTAVAPRVKSTILRFFLVFFFFSFFLSKHKIK
jgi:hypothetical protein